MPLPSLNAGPTHSLFIIRALHTYLGQPEMKAGGAHGITNIPKRVSPGAQHNNGRLPAIAARPYTTARPGPALGNRLSAWAAAIGQGSGTGGQGRRSPRSTAGGCGWGPFPLQACFVVCAAAMARSHHTAGAAAARISSGSDGSR